MLQACGLGSSHAGDPTTLQGAFLVWVKWLHPFLWGRKGVPNATMASSVSEVYSKRKAPQGSRRSVARQATRVCCSRFLFERVVIRKTFAGRREVLMGKRLLLEGKSEIDGKD